MTHVEYRADEDLGIISFSPTTPGEDINAPPQTPLVTKFQFQHGPVDKNGVNGVQNEDVLLLLTIRLRALNAAYPCRENSIAITHIETALLWLRERTRVRIEQRVEGKNEPHVS